MGGCGWPWGAGEEGEVRFRLGAEGSHKVFELKVGGTGGGGEVGGGEGGVRSGEVGGGCDRVVRGGGGGGEFGVV